MPFSKQLGPLLLPKCPGSFYFIHPEPIPGHCNLALSCHEHGLRVYSAQISHISSPCLHCSFVMYPFAFFVIVSVTSLTVSPIPAVSYAFFPAWLTSFFKHNNIAIDLYNHISAQCTE